MRETCMTTDPSQNPKIQLALRAWGAARRREHALGPAVAAFEATVPGRLREDERFQRALEDAETAESLQRAVGLHEGETGEWAEKGVALLRAIEGADDAYEQELREALDAYRVSFKGGNGDNDTNGVHAH